MKESITAFLVQFPVVTLFAVIGVGYLIGQVRVFGFRLGVAGVLFAGLAAGALGPEVALPTIVSTVGLDPVHLQHWDSVRTGIPEPLPPRRIPRQCLLHRRAAVRRRGGAWGRGVAGALRTLPGRAVLRRPHQRARACGRAGSPARASQRATRHRLRYRLSVRRARRHAQLSALPRRVRHQAGQGRARRAYRGAQFRGPESRHRGPEPGRRSARAP